MTKPDIKIALMLLAGLVVGGDWAPAHAEDELHCQAIGVAENNHARATTFRTNGLIDRPGNSLEGIGICGGTVERFVWEVRASGFGQDDGYATDALYLRQLYRRFEINEDWGLTAGRGLRAWDVGYVAQPTDFLGSGKSIYDLEDRLSQRRTSTFAALDHFVDGWTLNAIVGQYHGFDRSLPQAILSADADIKGTHMTLLGQKTRYQPVGVGADISSVIGQSLELHASGFARQGTDRPIHQSLLDNDFRFYPSGSTPVSSWRRDDERWYPRWVVGGQWTDDSGLNLMLEWKYDASGLSKSQWNRLMSLTDFHANGGQLGVSSSAINGNLKNDAATMQSNGTMRSYLFLRAAYPQEWLESEIHTLINLADGSSNWGVRFTHNLTDSVKSWIEFNANVGSGHQEFAQVPLARNVLLALSTTF